MDRARRRRYDRDYTHRHYADPLETPPEPMGFWGLSRRSRRWSREEDRWGTSERARERERGRATERESERATKRESNRAGRGQRADRGLWGAPGYGWGSERRIGAYERPPRGYGRGSERRIGAYEQPSRDRGRNRPPEEAGREHYDRIRRRARERDLQRALERERDRARQGARERWGRPSPGRPDVRRGEAWREMGPRGWNPERWPEHREDFAREWDRGFYFGRADKGGGTPPFVGRHGWTAGTGPGGQEKVEEYGPPASRARRDRRGR